MEDRLRAKEFAMAKKADEKKKRQEQDARTKDAQPTPEALAFLAAGMPADEPVMTEGTSTPNPVEVEEPSPARSFKTKSPAFRTSKDQPDPTPEVLDNIETPASNDEEKKGNLSSLFQSALVNFVPMIVGGMFEGSEGAVAAHAGAQQMLDAEQKRRMMEEENARADEGIKIKREDLGLKRDQQREIQDYRNKMLGLQQEKMSAAEQNRLRSTNEKVDKEQVQIRKEQREELGKIEEAEMTAMDRLAALEDIERQYEQYQKNSIIGTGPVSNLLDVKKTLDPETNMLDAAFKGLNLDTMVKMFQGLARSIDSDAERRAFEAAQPSIYNHPEANRDIFRRKKEALVSLIKKSLAARERLQERGSSEFASGEATQQRLSALEAERQRRAAAKAGN